MSILKTMLNPASSRLTEIGHEGFWNEFWYGHDINYTDFNERDTPAISREIALRLTLAFFLAFLTQSTYPT